MGRDRHRSILIFSGLVSLGAVSFVSCFAAEFKKATERDVRWDAKKLCYVPGSHSSGLGIAALLCLTLAQIIGNIMVYKSYRSRNKTEDGCKAKEPRISGVLLFLSWISFLVALMVLSTATSMSKPQLYGEGWLDGDCYLVKPGVFSGSGVLVLLTGALLITATTTINKKQVDKDELRKQQERIKIEKQETTEQGSVVVEGGDSTKQHFHQSKLKSYDVDVVSQI